MKGKLAELRGEIGRSPVIVGDLNTPLSVVDRTRLDEQESRRLV